MYKESTLGVHKSQDMKEKKLSMLKRAIEKRDLGKGQDYIEGQKKDKKEQE